MEIVSILRELWRLKLAVVVVAIPAAVVALSTLYHLPSMQRRALAIGTASTQILVESSKPSLAAIDQDMAPLVTRAAVYARFMTSDTVQAAIARHAGVPAARITVDAPIDPSGPEGAIQPPAERRSNQLAVEARRNRLFIQNEMALPILDVSAQAPDVAGAIRLADAAPAGLRDALAQLDESQGVPPEDRIRIIQLGPAEGAPVYQGGSKILATLAFIVVFVLGCIGVLFIARVARDWRTVTADEYGAWSDEVLFTAPEDGHPVPPRG
jgi:hypothetical protein